MSLRLWIAYAVILFLVTWGLAILIYVTRGSRAFGRSQRRSARLRRDGADAQPVGEP